MKRLLPLLAAVLLPGCAGFGGADYVSTAAHDCSEWYRAVDAEIDAAGVRDAQDRRVAGFPYLRTNRLLSSFRGEAAASPRVLHALVDRMQALDLQARNLEIANLPQGRLPAAPGASAQAINATLRRAQDCTQRLREADLAVPARRKALLEGATVPDDYSTTSRVLGLYALTKLPFSSGVRRYHEDVRTAFARDLAPPPEGWVVRFAPPPPLEFDHELVAAMLARAAEDPLGMPLPTRRELHALFATYAPSFEIELTGDHDRFGELRLRRGATTPVVEAASSAVYTNLAWTRYRDRVLLQLVYTIWFPERPSDGSLDLLEGKLDGVTWRVTLDPEGGPLLFDAMHPCGCFHLFFPTPRAEPIAAPEGETEWAFVPQRLPDFARGERPLLRIATRTHYVERVSVVRGTDSVVRYELQAYDELRSLSDMAGGRRSVFGPDGLVAGTERAERFLFWPMGIASAGAMRQWGRHATAFVGRRHFDDADLIERRFNLAIPERAR